MEQAQQHETSKPGHDFEARVNALTRVALDAVVMMDAEGRITDWNPQAEITFGWSREEAMGRLLSHTIIPLRYQEAHKRGLGRFLETGGKEVLIKRMEIEAVHRDGREFPVDLAISAVHSGGVWTFVAFVRDTSLRKRVEEALADEAEALYSLMDSAQDSIYFKDSAGRFTRINRAHARALGISDPLQAVGKTDADFFDPDFAQAAQADEQQMMQSGTSLIGKVECVRPNGGTEVWYSTTKVVLKDSKQRVAGILGIWRDITQLNRVQEELQASNEELDHRVAERTREVVEREARIRRLVDANILGIFIWNLEGAIVGANEAFLRMVQYGRDDLLSGRVRWTDLTPAEWRERDERAVTDLKGTGTVQPYEKEYFRRDGSRVPVLVGGALFQQGGNEGVAFVLDLSEQKRAEEKIREQEAELRQILDLTPQHIGAHGLDGSPLYANHAALEYFGVTIDQWRAETSRLDFVHPDDREHFLGEIETRFLEGAPFEFEARLLRHDGEFRWFLVHRNPVKDERGQITRWYTTATDIEDRKQAEEGIRKENLALREEITTKAMFEEIVGTSPALQTVLSRVSKVALSDSTVLITGETGTGKELVARAIHRRSDRASRAFVSVNCAAVPRDLIASELFGHEKGAFTGATQQRLGRFELASGGTIFLDEVGELPAETQIALLRVLQEHEFERVGGTRQIRADVRVIAATNRDLPAAIRAGSFRNDLFYRLNVFPIEIPPLRKRREDVPLLVEYFINRYAQKAVKNIRSVNKKTLELLQSYPWPGNIRELQNVVERSVILCETEIFSIDESWLPQQQFLTEPKDQTELSRSLLAQEKNMIEAALEECGGRVFGTSGAAAKLGIPRSTLESKIRKLKINKNRFKAADPS